LGFNVVKELLSNKLEQMKMLIAATKIFAANPKLAAALLAGVTFLSFGSAANALTYTTSGTPQQISLGDTLGTDFDKLDIQGVTGTISPGPITLNTLTFTAGVNADVAADYNNLSFAENVTIGAGAGTLTVPFNLSINYTDTLMIVGGATLSILVGSDLWTLVVDGLTISNDGSGPISASLTAQVSESAATPLPAALVLFGSGLGALGLFGRRRKRVTATSPVT
jgi:hypothetical protein